MRRIFPSPALFAAALSFAVVLDAEASTFRTGDNFTVKRSDLRVTDGDYIESIDMLFKVRRDGALSIGTSLGTVNVRTWSRDEVRLVVDKRATAASELDARRIFDMFRIQALHGGKDLQLTARARTSEAARMGVTFTIWVPRSYNVDVKTESGNIAIPELDGKFTARTAEGKITVDCDPDDVKLEVRDGKAEARSGSKVEESRDVPQTSSGNSVRR